LKRNSAKSNNTVQTLKAKRRGTSKRAKQGTSEGEELVRRERKSKKQWGGNRRRTGDTMPWGKYASTSKKGLWPEWGKNLRDGTGGKKGEVGRGETRVKKQHHKTGMKEKENGEQNGRTESEKKLQCRDKGLKKSTHEATTNKGGERV